MSILINKVRLTIYLVEFVHILGKDNFIAKFGPNSALVFTELEVPLAISVAAY